MICKDSDELIKRTERKIEIPLYCWNASNTVIKAEIPREY
jgi:hypothetical protein